jgi:hypothetical protein
MFAGRVGERPVLMDIEKDGGIILAYMDSHTRYARYLSGDRDGKNIRTENIRNGDPVIVGVLGNNIFTGIWTRGREKKAVAVRRVLNN